MCSDAVRRTISLPIRQTHTFEKSNETTKANTPKVEVSVERKLVWNEKRITFVVLSLFW